MSKFCGKCGSKLDEKTGLCQNCENFVQYNSDNLMMKKSPKGLVLKTTIVFFILIIVLLTVFILDYCGIIGTGISESFGLISSGTFEISSDTDYIFTSVEEEYKVSFYCQPKVEFSSINLYSNDTNSLVASFYDNGETLENGDLKYDDNVYSSLVGIKEKDEKTLSFYAIIKDGFKYYESNIIEIHVQNDWSVEQLSNTQYVDDEIQNLLKDKNYEKKTIEDKSADVNNLLAELSQGEKPLIIEESICYDELVQIYSFQYADGTLGAVKIDGESEETIIGGSSSSAMNASIEKNMVSTANNGSQISSKAVIMYDWFTNKDEILEYYEEYQEEWNNSGLSTELSINPTVEDYKTQLVDNNLILIAAHGSRYTLGLFNQTTYSVICTHEERSKDLDKKYKYDIKQKHVVKANTEDGEMYWLMPSFFSTHYDNGELNDSIILINSCCGFGENEDIDYDLAGNMTGAKAVVGFHNSVCIFQSFSLSEGVHYIKSYGTLFLEDIVAYLLQAYDIATAFAKAQSLLGETQYQFFEDYGYNCNEDDKKVYPLIVGTATSKLNSSIQSEYKTGNRLLQVGNKYICSDGNAIYYKNSINEKGKKIADKNNGRLMSDGETVYFSRETTNEISEFISCYVYSVNIDGTNLKQLFTSNGYVDFISKNEDNLIYIDQTDYAQRDIFYTYNLSSGNISKCNGLNLDNYKNHTIENYKCHNGRVYLLMTNIDEQNDDYLLSYDFKTNHLNTILSGSMIHYCHKNANENKLYFTSCSFDFETNNKNNCYIYSIDEDHNLTKSNKLPANLSNVEIVSNDGSYVMFTRTGDYDFNLYKFDLNTGNITTIKNGSISFKNKGAGLVYDLEKPNDIYVSSLNWKFNGNGFNKCKCDCKNFNPYDYSWIVDGFFINSNFEYYEIK